MRYVSFSFMSFLRLLALFFLPVMRVPVQARAAPNIRSTASLRARDKGHASHLPASGDRSILSATFFSARRRRLIHDRRLMMA